MTDAPPPPCGSDSSLVSDPANQGGALLPAASRRQLHDTLCPVYHRVRRRRHPRGKPRFLWPLVRFAPGAGPPCGGAVLVLAVEGRRVLLDGVLDVVELLAGAADTVVEDGDGGALTFLRLFTHHSNIEASASAQTAITVETRDGTRWSAGRGKPECQVEANAN